MVTITTDVDIDVDIDEFDIEEIIEYLEFLGYTVSGSLGVKKDHKQWLLEELRNNYDLVTNTYAREIYESLLID